MLDWQKSYSFDPGPDGLPLPGQVIQEFRTRLGWTQQDLANALGVDRKVVGSMEKGKGLSFERRRVLSVALGIPPLLLGLAWFKGAPETQEAFQSMLKSGPVLDLAQLQSQREALWKQHFSQTLDESQAIRAINSLNAHLKSGKLSSEQKKIVLKDMLGYYLTAIETQRRERKYRNALQYIQTALNIANRLNSPEVFASLEIEIGLTYYERGTQNDYLTAKEAFTRALNFAKQSQDPALLRTVQMEASVALVQAAQDEQEKLQALKLLDSASSKLGASSYNAVFPLLPMHGTQFNNLAGLAHLRAGNLTTAEQYLDAAYDDVNKNYPGLLGYNHVYRAELELKRGKFESATERAQDALSIFIKRKSSRGVQKVQTLTDLLNDSTFKKDPGVAWLNTRLYTFQQK